MPDRRRLAAVLAVVVGLILPWSPSGPTAPLEAQVIRSYEALDRDAGERFYSTLAVSLDASGGNVEYTEFEFSGATGFRGERNFVRLYPAIRFRRDDGVTLEEERAVHLRHSYAFTERLQSFSFVQYQSDAALDLERRFLIGGGLRRRLISLADGGLDIGLGVMWEEERTTSEPEVEDFRGANLLVANGAAGAVDVNFTGFFQPRLDDWADHRVSASGTAAVPLGSAWTLTVSARWRRDSRPPPDIERDDYGIVVGLRFSID